jgi:hypothetical protein
MPQGGETARARISLVFFPRKRFGWGPPTTWQGWVFLLLWVASFTAVARTKSLMNVLASLALIGFALFVASIEERE